MLPTVKRLNRTLLVITAVATLPVVSTATALAGPAPAGPAPAAKTWAVQPGGAFTGASTVALKITDTTTKLSLSCKSASIGGTLKSGSGLPAGIGTITSSTVGKCGVGSGFTASALSWSLTATSYTAGTGVTSGSIGDVHIAVSAIGCTFSVDGTGGSANDGTVNIKYTNGTHDLKILANTGNLHIYHPSGCSGVVHNGDKISEAATYSLAPAQTITSP